MDSPQILQMLAAAAILLLSSTVFSTLGFGIGLVSIPLLLLVIDSQTAVVIVNTISLVIVILVVLRNRSYLRVGEIIPMAAAGLAGALTGVFVLNALDNRVLGIVILALIIAFTIASMFNINMPTPAPRVMGPALGFVASLLITATGIGGPLMVLFMLALGWHRHTIRASLALFFVFTMLAAAGGYAYSGLYTRQSLLLLAAVAVPALIGFWLGNKLAYAINERIFRHAVTGLILVTSMIALAREVSRL